MSIDIYETANNMHTMEKWASLKTNAHLHIVVVVACRVYGWINIYLICFIPKWKTSIMLGFIFDEVTDAGSNAGFSICIVFTYSLYPVS